MLTPAFELNQDETFVYVYIKTPYIKVQDVEYFIEEHHFKFYVKPYFLRLYFPGKITENGKESASYNVEKGLFTVCLPKLVPGTYFRDLDLVTKLLAPSGKSNIASPKIEVVSEGGSCLDNSDEDESTFDWEWKQEIYDEKKELQLGVVGEKYGFGNQKNGVFFRLKDELKDIVENPNPDELSYSERRTARIAAEDLKFDEEHYLADFFEDEEIKQILCYDIDKEVSFTEIEKEKLRQLPNREYIFDHNEEISVCYSLVDLMFAFAYNKRTTLGENTVESAWTISKLSPTLSWFERFSSLEEVLEACVRRSLSYPLFRHWKLSLKVLQDVKDLFQLGRRKILKCLLEILMLFNESEPRYLLNELYISDYCIWIQKVKESQVQSLSAKLLEAKISEESIGWDLKEIETAAILVYNEEKSHLSESESSSSEYSSEGSDTDTERSNYEDIDSAETLIKDNVPGVSGSCELPVETCKKDDYESFDDFNVKLARLNLEENNTDSETEMVAKVEVLPSLLFPKKTLDAKCLVEVISGEEDGKNKCVNSKEDFDLNENKHDC